LTVTSPLGIGTPEGSTLEFVVVVVVVVAGEVVFWTVAVALALLDVPSE
jgi:hypothetical protein